MGLKSKLAHAPFQVKIQLCDRDRTNRDHFLKVTPYVSHLISNFSIYQLEKICLFDQNNTLKK